MTTPAAAANSDVEIEERTLFVITDTEGREEALAHASTMRSE